jgi:hypothetical protein
MLERPKALTGQLGKVTVGYSMKLKSFAALVLEKLRSLATEIEPFVEAHFTVEPMNKPGNAVFVMNPHGDKVYSKLDDAGQSQQHDLLQQYKRTSALVIALFRQSATVNRRAVSASLSEISATISRNQPTWHSAAAEVTSDLRDSTARISSAVRAVFPERPGDCFVLADTNALYALPDFQNWDLDGIPKFTICLTPTVLQELDEHKVFHRNPAVVEKANTIINRIRELRRRGSLTQGVDVVKGSIRLVAMATEPNKQSSLPWLDLSVADDRIIASAIWIMQRNAGTPMVIATSDINLQNKCELAGIQQIDPATTGRSNKSLQLTPWVSS